MTLRQTLVLLETVLQVIVFLAFVVYCAWVGPKVLASGGRR